MPGGISLSNTKTRGVASGAQAVPALASGNGDTRRDDHDSPWKDALEVFLPQAIAMFAPDLHAQIDWTFPAEFLDKEFQALCHGIAHSRRHTDKLVRLRLTSGRFLCLLLHVEVQGGRVTKASLQRTTLRVQQYDYRIHDRYVLQPALQGKGCQSSATVYTLVIFTGQGNGPDCLTADHQPLQNAQPLRYHAVYLGRWLDDWNALERLAQTNPFAVIVMAQLLALRHRGAQRLQPKLGLVRQLIAHGYRRDSVVNLLRFIDWILALPPEVENTYIDAVEQIEKERAMAYVTSYERIYKQRGMEAGMELGKEIGKEIGLVQGERNTLLTMLQEQIEARFGSISAQDRELLQQAETGQLWLWARRIMGASSLQELLTQQP